MSTYSSNLKIELIGTGEQVGTWGSTTNDNFANVFEQAIVGRVTVDFATDANKTLTATDSVATQDYRNLYLNLTSTGSLTATRDLIVPTINKTYVVQNNTTGAQSIRVITTAGSGVTIPNGRTAALYVDGTNVIVAADWVDINGGSIDGTPIGANSTSTGAFTTVSASGQVTSTVTTGTAPLVIASITKVNNLNVDLLDGGDWAAPGTIGSGTANTGAFTTLTASADSSFTSTGAVQLSKGTTAQRPTAVSGKLRFNTDTGEFEGYNGTAWASVGGAALVNDTSTTSNLFPLFATATTGTAATLNTSNAKLLYKPSTGEFQSSELVAGNGIFVNSKTVTASYTVPSGSNALSAGPVTVADGITVTVSDGSVWTVL
jgi:hypothetical protein